LKLYIKKLTKKSERTLNSPKKLKEKHHFIITTILSHLGNKRKTETNPTSQPKHQKKQRKLFQPHIPGVGQSKARKIPKEIFLSFSDI